MAASNPKFSERRAFIIGINAYEHVSTLETPINDGIALKKVLIEEFGYREAPVEACYNPNKKALLDFLAGMKKAVKDDDSVIFYFAGHGIARDEADGLKGFILPTDADLNDYDTLVSMQELFDVFSELPCRHFLLVLDCCFAGAFRWATKYRVVSSIIQEPISRQHYDHYTNHSAWQVITSASHTQKAIDLLGNRVEADGGNSPFAKLIMEGLRGKADFNGDHIITASELSTYVGDRLRSITSTQEHQAQSIVFFPLPKHGNGEFIFQPSKFEVQQLLERDYDNPYMGLEAYTNDALFFGREDATNELLEAIKKNKLTVVIGASGTGKSSLVKAGIIPKLEREGNIVKEMRPGKYPMSVLNSIDPFCEVLVIDQFEEVITQSVEKEATAFLDLLKSKVAEGKLTIILTLRIDFESQINIKGIEIQWKDGRFLVPPFSPEDLREIIVSPAARVGRFIESEKLVDKIISEVVHFPGSLPLLSFTLTELFEKCKKDGLYRGIRESDYEELGGISGALQNVADKVFAELNDPGKQLLKNFMFRMVSLSGGEIAGKRVMKEDLPEDTTKKIDAIINKLIEVRLILSDRDLNNGKIYYEPAHDALVRSWGQLLGWIKSFGEDNIFLLQKLSVAVEDHLKTGDEEHLWHRNANLEPTFTLKEKEEGLFNLKELDFLHKSKEKKVNEIEALKAERDEAVRQKELAEKRLRMSNNENLINVNAQKNSNLAISLAIYNKSNHKSPVSFSTYRSLVDNGSIKFYKGKTCGEQEYSDRSPMCVLKDEKKILSCGYHDRSAKIIDINTGETLAIFEHEDYVVAIALSKYNKFVLTGSKDNTVKMWSLQGKLLHTYSEFGSGINSICISPDESYFVATTWKGDAKIIQLNGKLIGTLPTANRQVSNVLVDILNKNIITSGFDGFVRIWNLSGTMIKEFQAYPNNISSITISPNGKLLLVTHLDRSDVTLWDLNGERINTYFGHKKGVYCGDFSPDGSKILTGGTDKTIIEWQISGEIINKYFLQGAVASVKYFQSGLSFISKSQNLNRKLDLVIWEFDSNRKVYDLKNRENKSLYYPFYDPDSDEIADVFDMIPQKAYYDRNHYLIMDYLDGANINKIDISIKSNICVIINEDKKCIEIWKLKKQGKFEKAKNLINSPRPYKSISLLPDEHVRIFSRVILSPSGQLILWNNEHYIKIFDTEGNIIKKIDSSNFNCGNFQSVNFSLNEEIIVVGTEKGFILILNLSGEKLAVSKHSNSDIAVYCCCFTSYNKKIITAGKTDGQDTLKIWELQTGIYETIIAHESIINEMVVSTNQQKIATTSQSDGNVKIWNLEGVLLQTIVIEGSIFRIQFIDNDKKLLISTSIYTDGYPNKIKHLVCSIFEENLSENIYLFNLQELYREGAQLEPEDLLSLWAQGEKLATEDLELIGKSESLIIETHEMPELKKWDTIELVVGNTHVAKKLDN